MGRARIGIMLAALLVICGFSSDKTGSQRLSLAVSLPQSSQSLKHLDHTYYQIGYDTSHKQASWCAYLLTGEMVANNDAAKRGNTSFKKDPKLKKHYCVTSDYTKSGYVRGHLCPSKDMCWSEEAMKETFYMSNVSPQLSKLNNGLWKSLETKTRSWATEFDSIIVLTGPVLNDKIGEIGKNRVSVSGSFYKIIADISAPEYKMIAFVMDNADLKGGIFDYATSVRQVETLTGLDFFPEIDSIPLIDSLESHFATSQWQ